MSCNSTMEFEFKFILPRKNSDLLNGDGSAYFVEQTYNINEIPNKLKGKIIFIFFISNYKNWSMFGGYFFFLFHFRCKSSISII